jgi:predicted transcriptional regulator
MFCDQLISSEITSVNLNNTVEHTLQLMEDYHLRQFPVVDGGSFLGLIAEEDLLDFDSQKLVLELINKLI